MKKLLLFTVIVLGLSLWFSNNVFATSGACSSHGGVNCSAGQDIDGSVICSDGWRNSSVGYASMVMCKQSSPLNIKTNSSTVSKKDGIYINDDYGFSFQYKKYFYNVSDQFDTISFLQYMPAEFTKGFEDYNYIGAFCIYKNCEDANMDAIEIYGKSVIDGGISAEMKSGKSMADIFNGQITRKKINRIPVIANYDHPKIILNDPGYYRIQYSFFIGDDDMIVFTFKTESEVMYKLIKKDFENMMKTFKKI